MLQLEKPNSEVIMRSVKGLQTFTAIIQFLQLQSVEKIHFILSKIIYLFAPPPFLKCGSSVYLTFSDSFHGTIGN